MPSRKSVAGGVEPLDFAAADEAVGQLVEVVLLATRGRIGQAVAMTEPQKTDRSEREDRPGKTRTWWHPLLARLLD